MAQSIPILDLKREHEQIAPELDQAWRASLGAMQLLNGEQVRLFEREIAAYIGVPHACGVGSGTDALSLGLAALGVGRGHRVILPANAFVAALEAIDRLGAVPVLVDTEDDGFGPDIDAIEAELPARAVVVVHLYGAVLDLSRIEQLCRRHGAQLVEDGSHAPGARRGSRRAGSLGAAGCFSAGVVKNLGAYGDAGFVTTAHRPVADTIRCLQNHGQERKNHHVQYGCNSRLDELQAAVLRIKLPHLERRNQRRREVAAFYDARFAPLDIRVPSVGPDELPVYHQYVVRTAARDALQRHLQERGIGTGIHYPRPLHQQPAWKRTYGTSPVLPRAERLAGEILSLPVFPDLTDTEVESVATAVETFYVGRGRPAVPRERVGGLADDAPLGM